MRWAWVTSTLLACAPSTLVPPPTVEVVTIAAIPPPPAPEPPPRSEDACMQVTVGALHGPIAISSEHMTRAFAPVVRALCTCTEPGDEVRAVARLVPSEGRLTADIVGRDDVDRCVQKTIAPTFVPFEASSDCIACGPQRLQVFHAPAPVPTPATTVSVPLSFVHPAAPSDATEPDQSP